MGRRLERHIDSDLVDRIAAGWTPKSRTQPAKRKRTPRPSKNYRAARRNLVLRKHKGVWPNAATGSVQLERPGLNRSRHWDRANSYQSARVLSPSSEPVR